MSAFPPGPYDVVLADPPWRYAYWSERGRASTRAPDTHYGTVPTADLAGLGVAEIVARDAVLLLWATRLKLDEAPALMAAWGFAYRTVAFTWVKLNEDGSPFFGLGRYTRANAEFCLLGVRGDGLRVRDHGVGEVILSRRREHSRKPDGQYDRIERLFGPDTRRLELFARRRWPGWDAWGLEAPAEEPLMLPLEMSA